jgi:hypothetical protein
MPVRYDIAAQVPQASAGPDIMNMMAQYQAMGYRQQQNALAQMQMAEYQRKLQAEQALRGMTPNFADPRFAQQVFQYDPEFARQLYGSQLAGAREQASTENVRAEQRLRERKYSEIDLPRASREQQKLALETEETALRGKKLGFEINKDALDRNAKTLERMENVAAKVFNTNGRGYEDFRQMAVKEHPEFEKMLPAAYDPDVLSGFIDNAASTREKLKSASDYEYREITDPTGATRIVAIPKRSPQAGAIPVPGATGAKPADFGFMPGPPDTGLVTRTNPRTGEAELVTPRQPVMTPAEGKFGERVSGAPAPNRIIPSEIRPTTEAPVGSAAYNNKRFATEVLDASGFNAETGEDRVSQLIKGSTSGGLQAKAAGVRGFFGGAAPGMENIAKLETIKNDVVLKKLAGKLGAGISEGDRQFIEKLMGDIANPEVPANQRLAAWNQVKGMMVKYANTGQTARAQPSRVTERPSLDEIFK